MKLTQLLSGPSRWTQNSLAKNNAAKPCKPSDDSATCWCLMGGLDLCYPDPNERDVIRRRLHEFIVEGLAGWNDEPFRTFEEVRELISQANV